jgi:uncharacterized protein with HEPN domain
MRDILIHQYHAVDLPLVWKIAVHELPHVKKQLQAIYKALFS